MSSFKKYEGILHMMQSALPLSSLPYAFYIRFLKKTLNDVIYLFTEILIVLEKKGTKISTKYFGTVHIFPSNQCQS